MTITVRYNSYYSRVSGDLARLGKHSKLVEGNLIAIIDLSLGAKIIPCTLYGVWADDFTKNLNFKNVIFFFHFSLLHLMFSCYYCCIDFKRHEHSRLRPDTSRFVLSIFVTKLMVCLCSVGFFSSDKLRLFNYPFFDGFQYLSKVIVVMSLNLKKKCLFLIVFVK